MHALDLLEGSVRVSPRMKSCTCGENSRKMGVTIHKAAAMKLNINTQRERVNRPHTLLGVYIPAAPC